MRISELITRTTLATLLAFGAVGCGDHHSHEDGHAHHEEHRDHADHEDEDSTAHGHSHGDDAKSFSGATHKEGEGITLLPETAQQIGLKLEEVREEQLPQEIAFTARVFAIDAEDQFKASGILTAKDAQHLENGSKVSVHVAGGASFEGSVESASHTISTNETEVIVGFSAPGANVAPGNFVRVAASIPSPDLVTSIPKDALIKGTTESFVYVQNGDAYLRTVVKPGRESANSVEIRDGLLEGDSVVSKGAMDLWLVELRAIKGGQGCCPAPPAKGKGK